MRVPSARRTPPRRRAAERKTGDCIERSNLPLSEHQIRVARYLEDHHGVIAVHGIGTGKTLTAVATSQCFLDKFPDAKVIVISPSALIANFKKGMEEYGLEPDSRKYEFYSFKSFESKLNLAAYCAGNLLIVDEAHNLRTLVAGKKGKRAAQVINCARAVKRVLLLTATPFVNESMDLNNLVAMAKGTDPLTKTQWKNMYSDTQTRRGYLNCLFSVYFREQGDANYPRRVDKEIELEMDPEYLDEYLAIEETNEEKLEALGIKGSGAFLSSVRIALLKLKNSAKVNFVVEEVSKKVREGKKVVVYSNFVGVGVKSVGKQLAERGITFYEFTGATPARTRSKYVADYNSGKVKALLITKAAGEGLDLKGTNAIFILDPPWNEATLEQAIGRAIRYKSHAALPKDQRYVEVYTMYSVKPAEYMRQNPRAVGSADSMIKDMIDLKKAENKKLIEALGQYSIENNDCRSTKSMPKSFFTRPPH